MRKKVRKRQEKLDAVVGESARQEQKEGSSVAPQLIAPTSSPRNVDQGPRPPQGTAFQASAPNETMDNPHMASQVRPSITGGSNSHEEGQPVKTEPIAPTPGPITIDQDGSPQTAPQATPIGIMDTLHMTANGK
ncbi:hypothetical protein FA15DRAFT_296084 [Coprinopsis marcescibilis]|uniref:Uncharacterized protein n=1 Tax=Coprinopsis marcescibilis TaxID=230819 RepID=A0A5C3KD86_COPMA|nr:hypothetical protein FA15DRAFT_296084 [Coprinopsis marcescibilis]